MKIILNGLRVEVVRGDIARQRDIDAVVNAANAELLPGGGVAGAIHRAAGPGLVEECRPLAPIASGEAVVTGGHDLPNRWVIHCLGPVYGRDEPAAKLLADCYRNALRLAEEKGMRSIAFPAISTGAFGYPAQAAAEVSAGTIRDIAPTLEHVRLLRFVLFGTEMQRTVERAFETVAERG
ncbi:MAG: macro domain-containing protein [Gammaproteobacteria bacterium]